MYLGYRYNSPNLNCGGLLCPSSVDLQALLSILLFKDTQHHNKPHVHVYYGEYEASIGIDGELLAGSLPRRQMKIVVGWLALHEEEVYAAWNKAVQGQHFDKVRPM